MPVAVDEQRVPGEVGVQALHASLDRTVDAARLGLGVLDRVRRPRAASPGRGGSGRRRRDDRRPRGAEPATDALDELLASTGDFSHLEREEE